MTSGVTEITEICTKQDMSRWTRAHADAPGITWSVYPGPGGTMIIVEHEQSRSSLGAAQVSPEPAVAPAVIPENTGVLGTRVAKPFKTRPSHSAPSFA